MLTNYPIRSIIHKKPIYQNILIDERRKMDISKKSFEIWKNVAPDPNGTLTLKAICDRANANNMSMTKRRIIYYVHHEVLERWTRFGKEAYYKEDYIFPALTCISILRLKFGLMLGKVKNIMTANNGSVEALLDRLELFIKEYMDKKPTYYHALEAQFLKALTAGNLTVDFKKLEKEAHEVQEKHIKEKE